MIQHLFDSQFQIIGGFRNDFTEIEVKNEPMLFNCDADNAYDLGGVITKNFLDSLPDGWQSDVVFDSRVHMLMPRWFPAIPGFHHDDVPRGLSGQPDYSAMPYRAEHVMGLMNGDICPTVFAVGKHILPDIVDDIVYKRWHPIVEEQISMNILKEVEVPSGKLIAFDWQAMHTAQRARIGGWRWFGRISRKTDRVSKVTNEVRRQVQVYLEFPMEGW